METTPNTKPTHPKFVRWALMLGIVVVLNIFFWRLAALLIPEPQYNNFCAEALNEPPAQTNAASCQTAGGTWTDYGTAAALDGQTAPIRNGYCGCSQANSDAFQAAMSKHDLYAFALMVGLGILALIGGVMPIGSSIVSSGLSYGGVVTLIIGSGQYWSSAGQWVQLLIAAVGLGALVYLGVKRFRD